jgi:hypothetical protein
MTDVLGNKIARGNILYWKSKDIAVSVLDVVEPALEGNTQMPMLVIMIQVPIAGAERGKPIQLADFMRLVDPRSEGIIEGALRQ